MSTKVPQNTEDQEIDIFDISKSVSNFFTRINILAFRVVHFFIRNWILVLILICFGFGLGWFMDSNRKSYKNEIIVKPNFESVDYLYSKIDLLQSKIIAGDTVFLKNVVGISKPKEINSIKIKPISDAFKLVEDKEQNFDLIKLMAEDGDINKVLVDNVTSKNYTLHTITFISNDLTEEKNIVDPILKYLNTSVYFKDIQKIAYKNMEQEIAQNDTIISQIDNVLKGFSNTVKDNSKSEKLVYYNENTQLNDIIKTKQYLVIEQGKNKIKLASFDKTIKDISSTLNLKDTNFVNGKLKFTLPILFVLSFALIYLFKAFYKKQSQKFL